ncbi:hypothetical protein DLAC_04698 [Tieghemostelium lacteum]|uniref:RNA polymerase II subunit B1 CTD phosphatase RPAP2 homolog n=1 Tax=Tieghemostelium lacteum TaxID=361077 RepID=A0A151ZK78_TIELA|nr:hypothetical protein DLAC_04698 [Tieghemostelium lacteum]|eukprot:KYQ94401.1 hypothetical protein DLAC_04698 [Tieghemostelium lacteum]
MEEKDVNMSDKAVPEKPKVKVIKKVVKRRPVATTSNNTSQNNTTNVNNNNNNSKTKMDNTQEQENKVHPNVAKKMELVLNTQKEKFKYEKLTFNAQLHCLDNDVTEEELKTEYYKYFLPENYNDIVVERSIGMKCGYPCCKNYIEKNSTTQKLKISIQDQRVYNIEELSMYCSTDCLIKSNLFQSTLDTTPVYLRKWVHGELQDVEVKKKVEFLNNFEKKLNITENENASLQPPSSIYNNNVDNERVPIEIDNPSTTTTTMTSGINNVNIKKVDSQSDLLQSILEEMNGVINNSDGKTSNEDEESVDDESSEESEYDDENNDDKDNVAMTSQENDNDDEQESSDDEFNNSDNDEDEPYYGFLNNDQSGQFTKSFKASNYHLIYSALSEWMTKYTNQFFQSNGNSTLKVTQNHQIKTTLHHHLSTVYPLVVNNDLKLQVNIKQDLYLLIETFNLIRPIPSLKLNNWKLILLLFIKLLSFNLTVLKTELQSKEQIFLVLIKNYGLDLESFKVFENLCLNGYDD